ncbi:MAG TPA: hypothetical protein ENN35_00925 [Deltaproteobacteria bacterium]|nr:hypothetical protein [Deltaproteobacteria bacterium]
MIYIKVYLTVLGMLVLMAVGIIVDNGIRGTIEINRLKGDLRVLAPLMMTADTAVNNSARYIRHRSLTYPGSPFPDYPGQPDYLPSGMAWTIIDFPGVNTRLEIEGVPASGQKETP